jgi:6-phosphogluconolactonase (cycloisomerase 2 family)
MRVLNKTILIFVCLVSVLGPVAHPVHGQDAPSFVYTNDDTYWGSNTVSALRINAGGALTAVPGSPFSTGGIGYGGGSVAATRVVVSGKFLYASNTVSNSVAGFVISTADGSLTPIAGMPFSTGGVAGQSISLAATPNGAFLMAGHGYSGSMNITVFRINQTTGVLTTVSGSPFPAEGFVGAIKITPNGKFLAAALTYLNGIAMFGIGANGELTPVSGSPFAATFPAGLDINCQGNLLFAGEPNVGATIVHVLRIDASGSLAPISGSPFTFSGVGSNSNVAVLGPLDNLLFVSNQYTDTVTVLNIAPNGGLTLVPGVPFKVFGNGAPSGVATNPNGTLLYVTNRNKLISAMSVSATGNLTPVSGSPYIVGNTGSYAQSLAVYPQRRCSGAGQDR